ncbi:MAG: DUF721 domain-containing protein [Bacteroidia bacterium]
MAMHRFQYPDRNTRPLRDVPTMANAIDVWLQKTGFSEKMFEAAIMQDWREIAGVSIAKNTAKLSVHNRVLSLTIMSAPLRNELAMNKHKLINLINEYIKHNYIIDIRF